jgi:phosphatidylserine decarboxylase
MEPIRYIHRQTGQLEIEAVYGESMIHLLYGNGLFSRLLGTPLRYLLSGFPFCSWIYGYLQKLPITKVKMVPFIQKYQIDASEFLEKVEDFNSFNDFFIRKLKKESRPIAAGEKTAIIPADGRYRFYPNIADSEGFLVKGQKFDLAKLLQNDEQAARYSNGTMVIARLCPSDYHRYHFPCDGIPGKTRLINGWLYSVNPLALRKNIHIFTENKRSICELSTEYFGKVLFIEIGATAVGSIHQTYTPFQKYRKGDEKGYFSFGASSLILLFAPGAIELDKDLISTTDIEIKCLMGQSMGSASNQNQSHHDKRIMPAS